MPPAPIANDDSYSLDTVATGSTTLIITEGGQSSGGGGSTGGGGTGTGGGGTNPPNDGGEQIPAGFSLGTVTYQHLAAPSPEHAVVTMGKYFTQGEVPTGKFPILKTALNEVVNVQSDAKTRWPDGSLRFCRMAFVAAGSVTNGQKLTYTVDIADNNHPWDLITKSIIENSNFDLELSITEGGTTYTAYARNTLVLENSPNIWAQGGVCTSIVDLVSPFVDDQNNEHPNLEARFHIDALANSTSTATNDIAMVRCRWIIENTRSFLDRNGASNTFGKKTLTNLTVTMTDGNGDLVTEVMNLSNVEVARQGRITRQHTWHAAAGYQASYAQGVGHCAWTTYTNAKYDGVIPNYIQVDTASSVLTNYETEANNRTINSLLNFQINMGATGSDPSIGPLINSDAIYFAQAEPDKRMWNTVLASHEQSANWHCHVRDDATGQPLLVADHPNISLEGSSSTPAFPDWNTTWSQFTGGLTNWKLDVSHQPQFGLAPYLLTGDYFWLEEMQFWVTHNLIRLNPPYRDYGDGAIYREQLRGIGWSIRNLAHAVGCTPTTHPIYSALATNLENTRLKLQGFYITNPQQSGIGFVNHTGNTGIDEDGAFRFRPWMHAFYVHGIFAAYVWAGESWRQILRHACRLQGNAINHSQFCEKAITPYSYVVADSGGSTWQYTNYRQVLQATYPLYVGACPSSWSGINKLNTVNSYADHACMALAYAAEQGFYGAEATRAAMRAHAINEEGQGENFANTPLFSIAPRFIGTHEPIRAIPNRHWFDMSSIAGSEPDCRVTLPSDATGQIADYSGSCFDTKRNLLIMHGAGHTTGNNAIIGFNITTGLWQTVSARSPVETQHVEAYPDGTPSARHMYAGAVYIPEPFDKYFFGGGASYSSTGTYFNRGWIFDPNNYNPNDLGQAWTNVGNPLGNDYLNVAVWDSERELVIVHTSRNLAYFNPNDNTWTTHYFYNRYDQYFGDQHGGAYSNEHKKMVIVGKNVLWVWDLTDLENPIRTLISPTGPQAILAPNGPGCKYHPISKKFVLYHPDVSASSVFLLDPVTYQITEQLVSGSNSVVPNTAVSGAGANHGYRRFEWVPDCDAFISMPDITKKSFMIRIES